MNSLSILNNIKNPEKFEGLQQIKTNLINAIKNSLKNPQNRRNFVKKYVMINNPLFRTQISNIWKEVLLDILKNTHQSKSFTIRQTLLLYHDNDI